MKAKAIAVFPKEIVAIKDAIDTLCAMKGGSDDGVFESEIDRMAKHVDEMLERNGLKPRDYS